MRPPCSYAFFTHMSAMVFTHFLHIIIDHKLRKSCKTILQVDMSVLKIESLKMPEKINKCN